MRTCLKLSVSLYLCLAVTPGLGLAQGKQTANTLRLDNKENQPKASIADISWMQGYWIGEGLGGTCEEIWSRPLGNSMMGSFRLVKDKKVLFHEICTIVEEEESLVLKLKHFDANLKGWEEKDKALNFPLVKLTSTEVFFDGITFRKMPDGSLRAYVAIENRKTGTVREESITYRLAKERQPEGGAPPRARAALGVWDTGTSSPEPLTPEAIEQKSGWKAIASGEKADAFQGEAVISNGRVLAVARKQGTGVELYSLGSGMPVFRARLLLVHGASNDRVGLTENSRAAVGLEVASKAGAARFRLKRGELFIEAQAVSGEETLRVECPSRFAVLPDFFADDILFDARKVPVDEVELPSENFLLHFTGKQDAIVMGVFENRAQDVRVTLAGKGNERAISGSEIQFGKKGSKIWVAVLEDTGVWHSIDVSPADAKKILPLEWKMPFVAQWRVDFTRKDGLTDSWDMLLPEKEGNGFIKPSWLAQDGKISAPTRTATGEVDRDAYKPGGPASDRLGPDRHRWTTVLGRVQYPCWSDREGKGFLQPLEHKRLTFDGPVLIYAINRLAETPVTSYTPVDIVRSTLGVGPCQYILDVEGQKQEHVGRATCHVRTLLNEIYGSGRQKTKRKEIESYLGDALDFVTHIRNRILAYVAFGKELQNYLAEQRAAHPELKEQLDALEALAREIDARVEPRVQAILEHKLLKETAAKLVQQQVQPTPPVLAAQLNRDFVAKGLPDYEGADWEAKLKKEYTDPLTAIGGQQDEMVGECRWVVKALRQKAGILMATDPRMAPIAAEIRARTQKMLRGGAAYEGARH